MEWRAEKTQVDTYFDTIWWPEDEGLDGGCALRLKSGKYAASPTDVVDDSYDVGPFDTLEEAQAAALMFCKQEVP